VKVSVLITTYRRPKELKRAIESVLRSDWDVEVLVGDDGGGDLPALQDPRVKFYTFHHTGNPSYVRNRLAELATGELITFLDDDDEYTAGRIEIQAHHLLREGLEATFCNVMVVDSKNGVLMGLAYVPSSRPLLKRILFPFQDDGIVLQVGALMIKREVFFKIGGFNERLTLLEDWEFSLRLALKGYLHFHDFPGLLHYQNRKDSLRIKQQEVAAKRYAALMEVVSGYLPKKLFREVKAHFYLSLARRLVKRQRLKGISLATEGFFLNPSLHTALSFLKVMATLP